MKKRKGFTLIELLAVIAIMGVLAAAIGLTFRSGGSAAMPAAQRLLIGAVNAARSAAILRNTNAYLIIYDNPTGNLEKQLRFMGVVSEFDHDEDPGTDPVFIPVNDGIWLPSGVSFVPSDSTKSDGDRLFISSPPADPALSASFPTVDGAPEDWIAYGFNSRGNVISMGSAAPFLVVAPSRLDPASGDIIVESPEESRGVWIRPQGISMAISDFDEMEEVGLEVAAGGP